MGRIIESDRSIVPALDVHWGEVYDVVDATAGIEGIGAYKLGVYPVLTGGLYSTVKSIRNSMRRKGVSKPIIYDHQNAGNDSPAIGKKFADALAKAEVDAAMLLPLAGPETGRAWIEALRERDIGVLVGGLMAHVSSPGSDGGLIDDERVLDMYLTAADAGVTDFVVPGNQPGTIRQIRGLLEGRGIEPVFYSTGLVAQGGTVTESGKAAGDRWHAIIDEGIHDHYVVNTPTHMQQDFEKIRASAREYVSQL